MNQLLTICLVGVVTAGAASAGVIPEIGRTGKVAIQSHLGTFIKCHEGGGGMVTASASKVGPWETFEIYRVDAETITLKCGDHYLCAENGGGSLVLANRKVAGGWEKFKVRSDSNGLFGLQADNGKWLAAESHGAITATRDQRSAYETFRIVRPEESPMPNSPTTRIEIKVYKIFGVAPIWHTGTVIDGREYYYETPGRVSSIDVTSERMKNMEHHRTEYRLVHGDMARVKKTLADVSEKFNSYRYELLNRNCNVFTNELLDCLGVDGLDEEYLRQSGFGKAVRQVPGSSTVVEVFFKWPVQDKRLDLTFLDDLQKIERLPDDIRKEASRFLKRSIGTGLPFERGGGGPLNELGGKISEVANPFRW